MKRIYDYILKKPKKVFGSILGFIIGLAILLVGFFKTIFVVAFIFIGSYLGGKKDQGIQLKQLFISFIDRINKDYM